MDDHAWRMYGNYRVCLFPPQRLSLFRSVEKQKYCTVCLGFNPNSLTRCGSSKAFECRYVALFSYSKIITSKVEPREEVKMASRVILACFGDWLASVMIGCVLAHISRDKHMKVEDTARPCRCVRISSSNQKVRNLFAHGITPHIPAIAMESASNS